MAGSRRPAPSHPRRLARARDLSRWYTFRPGDLLLTGTPAGVGVGRKLPVFMRAGDVVEVEISGIGVLRNRIA